MISISSNYWEIQPVYHEPKIIWCTKNQLNLTPISTLPQRKSQVINPDPVITRPINTPTLLANSYRTQVAGSVINISLTHTNTHTHNTAAAPYAICVTSWRSHWPHIIPMTVCAMRSLRLRSISRVRNCLCMFCMAKNTHTDTRV